MKNTIKGIFGLILGVAVITLCGFSLYSLLTNNQPVEVSEIQYAENKSTFLETDKDVGGRSSYSEEKKKSIFNSKYKDHWMVWSGKLLKSDNGNLIISCTNSNTIDLSVELKDKSSGYNLINNQDITVRFLMKTQGGSFLPFGGKNAELLVLP